MYNCVMIIGITFIPMFSRRKPSCRQAKWLSQAVAESGFEPVPSESQSPHLCFLPDKGLLGHMWNSVLWMECKEETSSLFLLCPGSLWAMEHCWFVLHKLCHWPTEAHAVCWKIYREVQAWYPASLTCGWWAAVIPMWSPSAPFDSTAPEGWDCVDQQLSSSGCHHQLWTALGLGSCVYIRIVLGVDRVTAQWDLQKPCVGPALTPLTLGSRGKAAERKPLWWLRDPMMGQKDRAHF